MGESASIPTALEGGVVVGVECYLCKRNLPPKVAFIFLSRKRRHNPSGIWSTQCCDPGHSLAFLDLLPPFDCVGRHNVPAESSSAWERGSSPAKINISDGPGLIERFSRCRLETCVDTPASRLMPSGFFWIGRRRRIGMRRLVAMLKPRLTSMMAG